jgi:alpha-tubulin suppressor-like RCC1 family protein
MQSRAGRQWIAIAPMFAAMIVASCATDTANGPRLATLVAVSGSGQFGALGATLANPLVVRVEDQTGAPVEGVTVEWDVIAGGGTVTPSQSVTDQDGLASASLRLGSVTGVNSVAASLGQLQPVIFTATATTAPPAKLFVVAGAGQSGTVATQLPVDLVVKVTDAVDGPKAGVPVSFTVISGGGSLSAASALSDANGNATVKWTLGTAAGSQSVLASVSGVTPVTITATGVAGLPDALTILTGNNQTGTPGAPLPDSLRVRLTDRFGNPISGVTIVWTPNPGDGTVNPAISTTDVNGRAATRWTLGSTGGPKTVTATGGGFVRVFSGGGNVTYQVLSTGSRHTCGLATGGVAYCWGYNGDGQLGNGDIPAGSGPVFALPQPSGTEGNLTFALLLAGRFHSCATTLAGVGYCWGNNIDGRLGSAGTSATSPVPVSGGMTFGKIAPGNLHTCGLDLAGRAFCWGANVDGQVGDGTNLNRSSPTAVAGGMFYSSVKAGGLHSCAIDIAGNGWCWGNNGSGQLGNGSTTSSNAPSAVSGGLTMSAISAGFLHTCALNAAGAAYCWGNNASGQLGNGTNANSPAPTLVSGGLVFTGISAGLNHTCAVTGAGTVYCWGANATGQIGDGTTTSRTTPTLVSGGLVFRSVAAGDAHSCAVTTANVAYCWGDNEFGQLGDGTLVARFVPVRVAFQP